MLRYRSVQTHRLRSAPVISGGSAGSTARQVMSNGNTVPFQNDTQTTNYRCSRSRKYIAGASDVTWSSVTLDYVFFTSSQTSENSLITAGVLKVGIEYNGSYYPVTFSGGSATYSSPGGGGTIRSDVVAGLMLDPSLSREFYVDTDFVGPDVTSRVYPRSMQTVTWTGEGVLNTATPTTFTDGTLARGAKATATIVGNNITALAVTAGGVNYTVTAPVYAVEIGNGTNGSAGYTFYKQVGTAAISGGAVTSCTVTSGTPPTGLTAWSNPQIRIMYGTSTLTNAMAPTPGYTSSAITGIPSRAVKSLIINGDSLSRGNGNSLTPDFYGNQGMYEIGVGNRCGILNLGIGSSLASGWAAFSTTWPKLYAFMQTIYASGATENLHASGTNDANAGATDAQIITRLQTVSSLFINTLGYPIAFGTIIVRTTSTDSWATTANQTPNNAFFVTGGGRDNVNTALLNNTIVNTKGVKRSDTLTQDTTVTQAWRVDLGTVGTTRQTFDGTHDDYVMRGQALINTTWQSQFSSLLT